MLQLHLSDLQFNCLIQSVLYHSLDGTCGCVMPSPMILWILIGLYHQFVSSRPEPCVSFGSHRSCYHNKIRSIDLSHCCVIFRGYVPEVNVPSYAFGLLYISGELYFVYFITVQLNDLRKIVDGIMARWSYSSVCSLHYFIIIIIHAYIKVLNLSNTCQVHSVNCV